MRVPTKSAIVCQAKSMMFSGRYQKLLVQRRCHAFSAADHLLTSIFCAGLRKQHPSEWASWRQAMIMHPHWCNLASALDAPAVLADKAPAHGTLHMDSAASLMIS